MPTSTDPSRDPSRGRDRDPSTTSRDRGKDTSSGSGGGSGTGSGGKERIGNYVMGGEIGRGSFATVYKGYRSVSVGSLAWMLELMVGRVGWGPDLVSGSN